jgi:hypothetical protein
MKFLTAPKMTYLDSALVTSVDAQVDHYYVVDTAAAAVQITFPAGVGIGHWIIVQNAPANGPQLGGTAGHDITIRPGPGETIEGRPQDVLGPPRSEVTAAARPYHPTGEAAANSGFGPGWMHV